MDIDTAHQICEDLGISFFQPAHPKKVTGYNGVGVTKIKDAIYVPFKVEDHTSGALFWVTKLHRPIILGKA
jgi:hypothetical protein